MSDSNDIAESDIDNIIADIISHDVDNLNNDFDNFDNYDDNDNL